MNSRNTILTSVFIIFFMSLSVQLQAQIVEVDTSKVINRAVEEAIHSPKKASLYSAMLPGLGQAYNKKYWKIPLVYIGFGAIGYFINWNNKNYQINITAYNHLNNDTIPGNTKHIELAEKYGYNLNDPTSKKSFRDGLIRQQNYFRRNRDLLIISMLGFYGLNIIDASVDAHLFNFDISDDLSLKWQPTMQYVNNQTVFCVNCTVNF